MPKASVEDQQRTLRRSAQMGIRLGSAKPWPGDADADTVCDVVNAEGEAVSIHSPEFRAS